ncbi:hypothetical protein [Spirosoma sp. 209]|uniref:hypothetical protein n=1 Tax=Spirosoma sp. 209 TaxID=1955701 RepID=UPI001116FD4D|nr:hypothetical protein [Spirosoma sp. 209]
MNNKQFRPVAVILSLVLGFIIIKHFDFDTLAFKKPWLDFLYIITFISMLFYIFKDKAQNKWEKK